MQDACRVDILFTQCQSILSARLEARYAGLIRGKKGEETYKETAQSLIDEALEMLICQRLS